MAVAIVLGATESGKSFYVEHRFMKNWKRRIVFDSAHCFDGEKFKPKHFTDPKKMITEFKRWNTSEFNYIFRPDRDQDRKRAFDEVVSWSVALGRIQGKRVDVKERVLLVCDEADRLCTAGSASKKFEYIVNEGRHDNVDSVYICRDPNNLFIDCRKNVTTLVTFYNPMAKSMPFFVNLIGKELSEKVSKLPKYHYLTWKDNWEVTISDQNGKVYLKQGMK